MKLTVRVEPYQFMESPRKEWDNMGIMVCFHKRYTLGDEHDIDHTEFVSWDGIQEYLEKELGATHVLPIFMYDHGGCTINTTGFSCPWDSGQIGFIYTTKEKIEEFGVKEENVLDALRGEVDVYDQFLRGEIYYYVVEDENGKVYASCGGIYGLEYAEEQAQEELNYVYEVEAEAQAQFDAMC